MNSKKAQSVVQYAVLIACVAAACIAMQIYIKRAKEGSLRQVADNLGKQYAPTQTKGRSTITYSSKTQETTKTLSELAAHNLYGGDYDFNANDRNNEPNVYATETVSTLLESTNNESGNETVGKFGKSLFED